MTATPARGPRALAGVCGGLGSVAVLLWAASALPWFRVAVAGRAPVTFDGAQVAPSLTGLALLALAGVAAVVATAGVVRRVLGGMLAGAGGVVAAIGIRALLATPFATDAPASALPQPPPGLVVDDLRYQPTETTAAPWLAVAGGLLLLGIGLVVLVAEPRLARLGTRYANPARPRVEADPDRAAWRDLDAGRDPTERRDRTADAPGDGGDAPGGPVRPV